MNQDPNKNTHSSDATDKSGQFCYNNALQIGEIMLNTLTYSKTRCSNGCLLSAIRLDARYPRRALCNSQMRHRRSFCHSKSTPMAQGLLTQRFVCIYRPPQAAERRQVALLTNITDFFTPLFPTLNACPSCDTRSFQFLRNSAAATQPACHGPAATATPNRSCTAHVSFASRPTILEPLHHCQLF